ncbi:MAG: alanine racemase [Proteobacteria bacterium]|nr:alanine racemase [Pseudomonadota bacterium]
MQGILDISLKDVKNNWNILNLASNGKAAAVVKANAYGLGMIEITRALINAGCNYFYVANINEGIQLRKNIENKNITISIFEGLIENKEHEYFNYKLTPIINNLEQLERLTVFSNQGKKIKSILNIDTGMNRLGLNNKETDFLIKNKEIVYNLEWEFIMSHLANAETPSSKVNNEQLNKLLNFSKNFPNIKLTLSNSGGIGFGSKFILDQTRPGIGLYGINNFGKNIKLNSKNLRFPLKLYAPIIQIKEVGIGEAVSYGGIDLTKRKSTLATLGVGYADGWIRLLKTNNCINIQKKKCNIMGNITMDSFVLDVTDINNKSFKEGDYICLLDESNISKLLKDINLISYELLSLMGNRLIRKYK